MIIIYKHNNKFIDPEFAVDLHVNYILMLGTLKMSK